MRPADRLLVFAPHPDDEVLGCGGTLALAAASGAAIRVVVVSDGRLGLPFGSDAAVRERECLDGLKALGVAECDVEFWRFPDGAVPLSGDITLRYRRCVADFRPVHVFLPVPWEAHQDHRAVTRGFINALSGHWQGQLWLYETVTPMPVTPHLQDISAALTQKQQAMSCHASQLASFDYSRHIEHLAGLRGLQGGVAAAEGFQLYPWDGAWQNFFAPRPLVSVIVRARYQHLLEEALRSLAGQLYDLLEVIVVWFGERPPDFSASPMLDIRCVDGIAQRAVNLNRGIDAARGDFIAFLDEDDVVFMQHFGTVLDEFVANPTLDVCYGACRLMACRQDPDKVVRLREIHWPQPAYQAGQLLLRNTIALHAALVRRGVFNSERFDETLEAYEDWEFWARLEQRGYHFSSVEAVSVEYRLFDMDLDAADPLAELHQRKGYTQWARVVLEKILRRFKVDDLFTIEQRLTAAQQEVNQQVTRIAELERQVAAQRGDAERQGQERQLAQEVADATGMQVAPSQVIRRLAGQALPARVISLVCPVFNTDADLLAEMLTSVHEQSYPHWQLILVDDGSTRAETLATLDHFSKLMANDRRVEVLHLPRNGGISVATRAGLRRCRGEFVGFIDHDDRLDSDALLAVAVAICRQPRARLLYTDSRTIDHAGAIVNIYLKPDWSPETLFSFNFVNHLTVVRRDALQRLGAFGRGVDGSQDWDMLLRLANRLHPDEVVHIAEPLYDWRATRESVAYRPDAKPWTDKASRRVLARGVARLGVAGKVKVLPAKAGYAAHWKGDTPGVAVIIPTHSNAQGLALCLKGLLEQTEYPQIHIRVIANRCETPEMRAVFEEYHNHDKVEVLRDDRPFNWSALNNDAMKGLAAEYVLFLNDDVEIQEGDWLARMARYLALPGVGAVGARLNYPDGGLQHNGVRTDTDWVAANIQDDGDAQLSVPVRNVSAVTGACLLTRRSVFEESGGFDESLAVNYNDIDYCLAVRAAGYRIVQANDAVLVHHESRTRGHPEAMQWEQEKRIMRDKWGDFLAERYEPRYRHYLHGTKILSIE